MFFWKGRALAGTVARRPAPLSFGPHCCGAGRLTNSVWLNPPPAPRLCPSSGMLCGVLCHVLWRAARDAVPLRVVVTSELPIGAGLGSSAAFAVCVSAGLLHAIGAVEVSDDASNPWSAEALELINGWAFVVEKVIHGTPSGIDNAISTHGGALKFVKGVPPERLGAMPTLRILLVNTRVGRSTKEYVAKVRRNKDSFPAVSLVIDAMGSLAEQAVSVFEALKSAQDAADETAAAESMGHLEGLVELNQHLLNGIGVGHPALDEICKITKAHGLVAKLTGAGGGGCAVVLIKPGVADDKVAAATEALSAAGFDVFPTSVGSAGVRVA